VLIRTFGGEGKKEEILAGPEHVSVNLDEVFVVDRAPLTPSRQLLVFSTDGKFLRLFAQTGKDPGQLFDPCGVAFDSDDVFVAQPCSVSVFRRQGTFLRHWNIQNGRITSIAVDGPSVFLSNTGSSQVEVYNRLGNFVRHWTFPGFNPRGLIAAQGEVFVVDQTVLVCACVRCVASLCVLCRCLTISVCCDVRLEIR